MTKLVSLTSTVALSGFWLGLVPLFVAGGIPVPHQTGSCQIYRKGYRLSAPNSCTELHDSNE